MNLPKVSKVRRTPYTDARWVTRESHLKVKQDV